MATFQPNFILQFAQFTNQLFGLLAKAASKGVHVFVSTVSTLARKFLAADLGPYLQKQIKQNTPCTDPIASSTSLPVVATVTDEACTIGTVTSKTSIASSIIPAGAVLCDSGATIDCSKSGLGKIPGTFVENSGGDLKLGDSDASLCSLGTNLHALRRIGANGNSDVGIYRMHATPNGIADIISESEEVNKRKSSIIWHPNQPRRIISGLSEDDNCVLEMTMAPNGLGWLRIEPITDPVLIKSLLAKFWSMPTTLDPSELQSKGRLAQQCVPRWPDVEAALAPARSVDGPEGSEASHASRRAPSK